MTGREGCGIWGPWVTVKPEEGEGPTSAGAGWQRPDLAKMGVSPSRTQVGRWRLGTNSPGCSPVDSSSCHSWAGRDEPLSDLPWQRKHRGDHQQHRAPGEQRSWELLLRAVQEPGEGPLGSSGRGSSGQASVLERVWGAQEKQFLPSTSSPSTPSPSPHPQLLKKIKRCERKGTESVTEEKCAVLFSTSLTLGPNKLPIQLQVRLGPSPARGGAPGAPANTARPGSSLLMSALRPAGLGFMHVGAPGEWGGRELKCTLRGMMVRAVAYVPVGFCPSFCKKNYFP